MRPQAPSVCKKVLREQGCNDTLAVRVCDVRALDLVSEPLTRLVHAAYTPLTRLLHASHTPLRVCDVRALDLMRPLLCSFAHTHTHTYTHTHTHTLNCT